MKIRCYDIEWDKHEDDKTILPSEVIITLTKKELNSADVDCIIADKVTNATDYCIENIEWEVIK